MSRKKRKSDKNQLLREKIILVTGVINLIKAVIDLIKDFT